MSATFESTLRAIIRDEVRAALADMQPASTGELLTISEAATLARMHRVTITRMLTDGTLPRQGKGTPPGAGGLP